MIIPTGNAATHGGVTFRFRRMSAWRGFQVLEVLRPGMSAVAAKLSTGMSAEAMIAAAITEVPAETVEKARAALFEFVDFQDAHRGQPVVLRDREDEAFADLEPVHVYLVLAQAFAVNFRKSWDAIQSGIAAAGQDTL